MVYRFEFNRGEYPDCGLTSTSETEEISPGHYQQVEFTAAVPADVIQGVLLKQRSEGIDACVVNRGRDLTR